MSIKTSPFGPELEVHWASDIHQLSWVGRLLQVDIARDLDGNGKVLGLIIEFDTPRGFRVLDELDLARYWSSPEFRTGFHVLSVEAGGWASEQNDAQGFEGEYKEWLIVTGNTCVSVFCSQPPKISESSWEHIK